MGGFLWARSVRSKAMPSAPRQFVLTKRTCSQDHSCVRGWKNRPFVTFLRFGHRPCHCPRLFRGHCPGILPQGSPRVRPGILPQGMSRACKNDPVVQRANLGFLALRECAPSSGHHLASCRKGTFDCMRRLVVMSPREMGNVSRWS